jgi:hypothetical protein
LSIIVLFSLHIVQWLWLEILMWWKCAARQSCVVMTGGGCVVMTGGGCVVMTGGGCVVMTGGGCVVMTGC